MMKKFMACFFVSIIIFSTVFNSYVFAGNKYFRITSQLEHLDAIKNERESSSAKLLSLNNISKKRVVIFIPGYFGTEFIQKNDKEINDKQIKVWIPKTGSFEDNINAFINLKKMECDNQGNPINNDIRYVNWKDYKICLEENLENNNTVKSSDDYILGYGPMDCCKGFIVDGKENNVEFNGVAKEILNGSLKNLYDGFYYFGYDWRLDLSKSTKDLIDFVQENLEGASITFIAHSAGGLIAADFISQYDKSKVEVEKVITIACPHYGAPVSVYYQLTGKAFDNITDNNFVNLIKSLIQNFPSAYQLMPSKYYFEAYNKKYGRGLVNFCDETIKGISEKYDDYEKYSDFYKLLPEIIKPAKNQEYLSSIKINSILFDRSKEFYDRFINNKGEHILNSIDNFYNIVVYGDDTLSEFILKSSDKNKNAANLLNYGYTDGDGTVPVISATMGFSSPVNRTFYVDGTVLTKKGEGWGSHIDVLNYMGTVKLITEMLKIQGGGDEAAKKAYAELNKLSIKDGDNPWGISYGDYDRTEKEVYIPFFDMEQHWAEKYVSILVREGVVKGYEDWTYRPDNQITRAEAAVILGRLFKLNENKADKLNFSDEHEIPSWAYGYIKSAVDKGIIKGFEDNTFRASKNVTRQEFTVMFLRALGIDVEGMAMDLKFTDSIKIADWAKRYVVKAVEMGIINGYPDGTFNPEGSITRAEVCVVSVKSKN